MKEFVELTQKINSFDQANRQIIDAIISAKPHSLEEFIDVWNTISFCLSDGVSVTTASQEGKQRHQHMNRGESDRYLCSLFLHKDGQRGLSLQFWARNTPESAESASPIRLYNTKVVVQPLEGFAPFSYYDALMYLIRETSPAETKLLLYVRQKDSRLLLEEGADPEDIPLTKVFKRAGWKFLSYVKTENTKDELRRHRLTLKT